jgi:hypothetical protein
MPLGRPQDDNAYLLENVEAGRLVPARYTQVAERVRAVGSRILCAHSHIPGAAAAGDTMVINPGSVGLPAYEDPTQPAHVSESGSPLARYACCISTAKRRVSSTLPSRMIISPPPDARKRARIRRGRIFLPQAMHEIAA